MIVSFQFEIDQWLQTKSPAPIEVKRFVDILATGLYSCGIDPDSKHGMVFEVQIPPPPKIIVTETLVYLHNYTSFLCSNFKWSAF